MTKAFLEPIILKKENVDLFLKALSPEAIEKVKKIDEKLKCLDKEIEEMEKNTIPIEKIMEKYINE
jgi:hypothetical protein